MSSTTGVWPPLNPASPPVKPRDTHSLGEQAERVSEASVQPYFARLSEQPDASLALNVHLPFCPSRCLSCDRIAVVQHQPNELSLIHI